MLLAAALVLSTSPAAADRARLRWTPSASAVDVAGYLVHARRTDDHAPGSSSDAGLPPAGAGGIVEYLLEGLDPAVSYVVSVSGYSADRVEGARSNELVLAARTGPCAGRPEEAACDAGDRCVPGRCAGGTCVPRADLRVPGTALAARLVTRGRLLLGTGAFVTLGRVDPRVGGVAVEILDALGMLLYRADVPGTAFRVGDRGRRFRHALRAAPAGGIRRLVLGHRGDVLKVQLDALAADALAGAREPLTWLVHVGSGCVRQIDLTCRAGRRGRRCS